MPSTLGPVWVKGLGRVGSDLQVCAVMVVVAAVLIGTMFRHELRDLQHAAIAVEIRDHDVGLPRISLL